MPFCLEMKIKTNDKSPLITQPQNPYHLSKKKIQKPINFIKSLLLLLVQNKVQSSEVECVEYVKNHEQSERVGDVYLSRGHEGPDPDTEAPQDSVTGDADGSVPVAAQLARGVTRLRQPTFQALRVNQSYRAPASVCFCC